MNHPQGLPRHTDVLVVGAGPTGLSVAAGLRARGHSCVVVDQLTRGANTSRALVVHARTLEALEELGVDGTLVARGLVVPTFTIRDRAGVLVRVPFDQLPSRHAYALMVPQSSTEEVLLNRLEEGGGEVHRPYVVSTLDQVGDRVVVSGRRVDPEDGAGAPDGADAAGAEWQLEASYVVGADGMRSVVREAAGIPFAGGAYGQSFLLADIRLDWELPHDEVQLFFSPAGLVVVAPMPDGSHRVVATMEEAPEEPTVADLQRLLDARGPGRALVRDVGWGSRFRVHHRVAERYVAGRLVLAGDAAHVHSPAGGQGMNTGIQDALDLAGTLAGILDRGDSAGAAASALGAYEARRLPAARAVVSFTGQLTSLATVRGRPARYARNLLLRGLGALPPVPRALGMRLSQLNLR